MGEVQLSGVGRGTALAVLIQQDVLCQLELIFQLVQGAQPDADAVLIEEGHLVHIRKLDAGHVGAHACGIQRSQQGVQAFQPLVRFLLNSAGGAAVGGAVRGAVSLGLRRKGQLFAGLGRDRFAAVQGGQTGRLGRILFQDLQAAREGQPAGGGLHGPGRPGFCYPHHHGAGVIPLHPDILQHGEHFFQRGGLAAGVKTEDILFQMDIQRLQDLVAGIAAGLLHHTVRCLHLNGADLEQHRHGEVDPRADDTEQHDKGREPPHEPAPPDGGPGQLPLFPALPPDGVTPSVLPLHRPHPLAAAALGVLRAALGVPVLAAGRAAVPLIAPGGAPLAVLPAAGALCAALAAPPAGGKGDAVIRVGAVVHRALRIPAGAGRIGVIIGVRDGVAAGGISCVPAVP